MTQEIIEAEARPAESGSQKLIYNLMGGGAVSLAACMQEWVWPAEGDFLWKLGHAVGSLDGFYTAGFVIGVLCILGAVGVQLIRILFRASTARPAPPAR